MKVNKRVIIGTGTIAVIAIIFRKKIAAVAAVIMLLFMAMVARPEVCDDISRYEEFRSGPNAAEEYRDKWEMDESIWPEKITADMDVKDYKMVCYDPWDAQYLGYLVVKYDDSHYAAEAQRLEQYNSTEYKGYYGVTGKKDYELLAIYADSYNGFVYAMADKDNTIIYAEQIFCNSFMDLDYEKYMPREYFLDGFDATEDNPIAAERRELVESQK